MKHETRTPAAEEALAVFRRGAVDLIDERELAARLARSEAVGRPLRIKFGMDPSSPDLHVGHAVQLFKLRDLQELGHTIVLIVGDATALVGDPSGRNRLRPQLTRDEVRANMETYTRQASAALDLERAEVRYNYDWLGALGYQDVLALCGKTTVARILERDTFQTRMRAEEPIGLHELLYPLMQGWDSVVVEADVEVGGTDQLFNLLFGRHLQEQEGQPPQVCLTHPLIVGLDGRKMSKSYGNTVGFTDAPADMFGKVMSIEDAAMRTWYTHLTRVPEEEIDRVLAGHPRKAKARLAGEITAAFHGIAAAADAGAAFDRQFRDRELPEDIPHRAFPWPAEGVPLPVLLRELGLASSSSEARRVISQGGVRVAGEVVDDPRATLAPPSAELLLQVGKRRFLRVTDGGSSRGSG